MIFSTFLFSSEVLVNFFFQWNEFMELGKDVAEETLQARIANLAPNKCCTLIYTVRSYTISFCLVRDRTVEIFQWASDF